MEKKIPNRNNNFDIIRLIAACFVVFGHVYPLSGTAGGPGVLGMGVHTFGVKVFFFLSGYLVLDSWLRDPDLYNYFLRRFLRFFPALIVVVMITVLIIGPLFTTLSILDYFNDPRLVYYPLNIFLYINYYLPGVFEDNPIKNAANGSFWTLPVEFFAYCLVPLIFSNRIRLLVGIKGAIALIVAIGLDHWLRKSPDSHLIIYATDIYPSSQLLVFFAIGTFLRSLQLSSQIDARHFIGALAIWSVIPRGMIDTSWFAYVFVPLATLAFATAPKINFLKGNDVSYGIYLWAFPVSQCIWSFGFGRGDAFVMGVLTILVTVPIAFLSWRIIETPALKLKPVAKSDLVQSTA